MCVDDNIVYASSMHMPMHYFFPKKGCDICIIVTKYKIIIIYLI